MAESLQIEIDIGDAKQQLSDLKDGFEEVKKSTAGFESSAGNAVKKLADAMNTIKPLDPSFLAGFDQLSTAMGNLKTGNVNDLANELNKLGRVDVDKLAQNIEQISKALENLKVPPGLAEAAGAFNQLGEASKKMSVNVRESHEKIDEFDKGIGHLGKEMVNSLGYMSGFSVSLGVMLDPLREVLGSTKSWGEILGALTQRFGTFGTVAAIVGGVAIAFESLHMVVEKIIGGALEATEKFQSFVRVLDAVGGAGTGVKAFEDIHHAATATGQSVEVLMEATKRMTLALDNTTSSAVKVKTILDGVGTALTVAGAGAKQQEAVFESLARGMERGTIGMRELRQIQAQMPGAFRVMAESMGITEKQMLSMSKQGGITTDDLVRMATALKEKFGSQLAVALEQPQAQMQLFANAVHNMFLNLGTGNLGGIAAGIAAGMSKITEALNSPAIAMFTKVMGDLIGMLAGSLLGLLGGLAQGFLTFFNAIASGISKIGELAKGFLEFIGLGESNLNVIKNLVNGFELLGEGIGMLVGFFVTARAAMLVYSAGAAVVSGAMTLMSSAFVAARVAQLAFLATPVGAAITIAVAAIVGLGIVLNKLTKDHGDAGHAASDHATKLTAMSSGAQVAGKAISEFNDEAAKSPQSIIQAGNALLSYEAAAKRSVISIGEMKSAVAANTQTLKDNALSERSSERDSKSFIAGLNEQKQALSEVGQRYKGLAAEAKLSDIATKSMGGTSHNAADANNLHARSVHNVKDAIQQLDNEIKSATASEEDRKRRNAEYNDAIQEQINKIKQREAVEQEYKVALDSSEIAMVKQLQAMGQTKEAAVNLVTSYGLLTKSVQEQADIMQKDADQHIKAAEQIQKMVDKLQLEITKRKELAAASGQSAEAIKAQIAPYEALINRLQSVETEQIKAAAASRAAALVWKEGLDPLAAATKAAEELSAKFGIKMPEALAIAHAAIDKMLGDVKGVGDAHKDMGDKIESAMNKSGTATESFGSKFDKFALGALEKLGDLTKKFLEWLGVVEKAAPGTDKVNKGIEETGTAATGAKDKIDQLKVSHDKHAEAVVNDIDKQEKFAAATQRVEGASQQSTASLQKLAEGYVQVGQAAVMGWNSEDHLSETMAKSEGIREQLVAGTARYYEVLKEGLPAIKDNITGITELSAQRKIELENLESSSKTLKTYEKGYVDVFTVAGKYLYTLDAMKLKEKDISAARQEGIDTIKGELNELEAKKRGMEGLIEENTKYEATQARVIAMEKEDAAAKAAGKNGMDSISKAVKTAAIEYDEEKNSIQRNLLSLNDRAKALQEMKTIEAGAASGTAESKAKIDELIQKNEQDTASQLRRYDAYKTMSEIAKQVAENEDKLSGATAKAADASTKLGAGMENAAEKAHTFEAPLNAVGQAASKGVVETENWWKSLGQAGKVMDVTTASGEKLGEVMRSRVNDSIIGLSKSLKDVPVYAKELETGLIVDAQAAAKASEQFKQMGDAVLAPKGNLKEFHDIAQTAARGIQGLGEQFKVFDSEGKLAGTVTKNLKGDIVDLSGRLGEVKKYADSYNESQKKVAAESEKVATKEAAAAKAIADKATATQKAKDATLDYEKDMLKAVDTTGQLAEKTREVTDAEKASAAIEAERVAQMKAINDAAAEQQANREKDIAQLEKLKDAFGEVATSTDNVKTALDNCDASVSTMGQGLQLLNDASKTTVDQGSQVEATYNKENAAAKALGQTELELAKDATQANAALSGGGGGGQTDAQAQSTTQYKSGGIVGQSVDPVKSVDSRVFKNAPHFAEGGTTGGSNIFQMNGDGGIPSILHKNEAVVPLSKGRAIPVDINIKDLGKSPTFNMDPILHALTGISMGLTGTATGGSGTSLLDAIQVGVVTTTKAQKDAAAAAALGRNDGGGGLAFGLSPPPKLVDGPSQRAIHGSNPQKAHPLRQNHDMTGDLILDAVVPGMGGGGGDGSGGGGTPPPKVPARSVTVNVTMNSGRFDNFKMTQDQLAAAAKAAIDKAARQNG